MIKVFSAISFGGGSLPFSPPFVPAWFPVWFPGSSTVLIPLTIELITTDKTIIVEYLSKYPDVDRYQYDSVIDHDYAITWDGDPSPGPDTYRVSYGLGNSHGDPLVTGSPPTELAEWTESGGSLNHLLGYNVLTWQPKP